MGCLCSFPSQPKEMLVASFLLPLFFFSFRLPAVIVGEDAGATFPERFFPIWRFFFLVLPVSLRGGRAELFELAFFLLPVAGEVGSDRGRVFLPFFPILLPLKFPPFCAGEMTSFPLFFLGPGPMGEEGGGPCFLPIAARKGKNPPLFFPLELLMGTLSFFFFLPGGPGDDVETGRWVLP